MAIDTATTSGTTKVSSDNARQFQAIFKAVVVCRVTFEEDSLGAGLATAAVYTEVTGARVGDFVLVAPLSDLGDDISFTAQVTANDEVTVIAQDQTAATNTSAATVGNLNLCVLRVDPGLFAAASSF